MSYILITEQISNEYIYFNNNGNKDYWRTDVVIDGLNIDKLSYYIPPFSYDEVDGILWPFRREGNLKGDSMAFCLSQNNIDVIIEGLCYDLSQSEILLNTVLYISIIGLRIPRYGNIQVILGSIPRCVYIFFDINLTHICIFFLQYFSC